MAISYITNQLNNSGTSVVSSISSASYTPASGNCLVIVGGNEFGGAVTHLTLSTTTGNTIPSSQDGIIHEYNGTGGNNIAVWVIPNVNSTAGTWTVTETSSTGFMQVDIYEYSGVDSGGAQDGVAVATNSNVSGSVTTTANTSMVICAGCFGASNSGGRSSTHSGGFTQRGNDSVAGSTCASCLADDIGPAVGSYSDTITWSPSVGATFCSTVIFALKAAAIAAQGPPMSGRQIYVMP